MPSATESLRVINMQKRRLRVLAAARGLLTEGGYEGMNVRDVARLADVTVPTIYNLIGKKEELLVALFAEVLAEIESRIHTVVDHAPLAMASAVVTESTGLFAEDEDFYRSAFLAVEYLDQSGVHHDKVAQLYAWGERLIIDGCNACSGARLLRGTIDVSHLGESMLRNYRSLCRSWALGQLSIEAFRVSALTDLYLILAADAVDTFHALLTRKIAALAAEQKQSPTRRGGTREQRP